MENIYSVKEVAIRYGKGVWTVLQWIKNKQLAACKIGNAFFVKESDLEKFEDAGRTIPMK